MNLNKSLSWIAAAIFALGSVPSIALAQPGSFGGGYGPPLNVVPPPKTFATSDEHYAYLFEQAKRGTKHTINSVPRWDGLWVTAGLGIAIGFGLLQLALIATLLTLFVFAGLWRLEKFISPATAPEEQGRE